MVCSLISLDWLLNIPFPKGAIAGWIALSVYAGIFPGVWCVLNGTAGEGGNWGQRQRFALMCALSWVGLELARSHLLGGFPVNLLGVSQYRNVPLIQISSITGVYGVSFLVVWFSASLLNVLRALKQERAYRGLMGEIAIQLLVILGTSIWGMGRVRNAPAPDRFVKLSMVQPAIPQELIFEPGEGTNRFEQLLRLSEKALASDSQCLIWPEAAMPPWSSENYKALTNFIALKKVSMVLGCDDAEPETIEGKTQYKYYNAAFLFNEKGQHAGSYRKKRLVIFGEYVPMLKWLSFLRYLTPIESSYEAGEKSVSFPIPGSDARCSVLICFEDFFPHGGPEAVFPETDFLLNLTNDGWFKEGMMQWQHAINGLFRAVENGVPLVRSTNNGLTCWIDAYGRIREVFKDERGSVYGVGVFNVDLPIVSSVKRAET
ncbi:MAG: Apolipoprotein N-acyltransferase, partial [Actinomycetia bacterium]|nr:Apolipoprotein N-acyltransferase [Actinomycetes bacterium]